MKCNRMLALGLVQHPPVHGTEDERAPLVTLRAQCRQRVITQRNVSTPPALRLGHMAARHRLPNAQEPLVKINILPPQRQQLALT